MIAPERAARLFRDAWGRAPSWAACAPGRVNLIGEHIDYHGGPVLPAALERGVTVALAPRDDARVRARTVDLDGRDLHPPEAFVVDAALRRDPGGGWGNYVRAAALAAGEPMGADLVVISDLPEASGLSSSSALVVAVGIGLMAAGGRLGVLDDTRRRALAEHFARAERFTGTEGGGMDQAASLGGRAGHALRITFDPLAWRAVPLPPTVAVVVAHSGVRAEKSGAAQAAYNRIRAGADDPVIAAHNRTEAERVDAFVALLSGGGTATAPLARLGELMDASHASLRDRLGVSHPTLERLVTTAREAGAVGARLTGAGFGGSIVALTHPEVADEVVQALRRVQTTLPGHPDPAFLATAGAGAHVTRLD